MDNCPKKNLSMVNLICVNLGFKNVIKSDNPVEDAENIFREVDKNNTGFIDYHGFGFK